jgi:hypothetical protein
VKREIVVSVNFPQTFKIEIDDEEDIEVIRNRIANQASYLMDTSESRPIITWSDWDDVVE